MTTSPFEWIERHPSLYPTLLAGGYWGGILGFSRYLISAEGQILSLWRRREWGYSPRLLRPTCWGKYLGVILIADDGTHRREYVHRLVLEVCDRPSEKGEEGRHLNGIRPHNRITNLAWGSRSENAADRVVHGTNMAGESNPQARLTDAKVREMRALYATGRASFKRIADWYDVSTMTAYRAIRRLSWKEA